jgi:hypothetical protein
MNRFTLLGPLALASVLACNTARPQDGDVNSGSALVTQPAATQAGKPQYGCELVFLGGTDRIAVGTHEDSFDGYPKFKLTLGQDAPYRLVVEATPATLPTGVISTTDGYFGLALAGPDGNEVGYTEAEVSLRQLGADGELTLDAGYLQQPVPQFAYAGHTIDLVEAHCHLTPAPN